MYSDSDLYGDADSGIVSGSDCDIDIGSASGSGVDSVYIVTVILVVVVVLIVVSASILIVIWLVAALVCGGMYMYSAIGSGTDRCSYSDIYVYW